MKMWKKRLEDLSVLEMLEILSGKTAMRIQNSKTTFYKVEKDKNGKAQDR